MKRTPPRVAVALLVAPAVVVLFAARLAAGPRVDVPSGPAASPRTATSASAPHASADQTAVFAGGCFWGVEAVFEHLRGVTSATSGYAGGSTAAPSYERVSSGKTGHAEAVRVVYDPSQITYDELLRVFFAVAHDPTQLNRQGPDVGTQYRSVVFYGDDDQRRAVEAYVAELRAAKAFSRPIVTEVVPLKEFYPAEEYHQDYMAHHPDAPYIVMHDAPKLKRLRREFPALYRQPAKD
jgi:peptide-methionine (S)-S-oxide reductase